KTAERITLELKDRLPRAVEPEATGPAAGADLREDVVSALVNLGYPRAAAERAAAAALADGGGFEEALKRALRLLTRA
ncbi:MAG TPA: hypothetical protein VNI83_14630, partial [Vicinamibacterales bacterium]|nr:hypothetical protein [Vicinamibacterales bacterium]